MKTSTTFWFVLLVIFLPASSLYATDNEPIASSSFPSLISSLTSNFALAFCGGTVPIENAEVRERFEKELLLTLWNRSQVLLWLKRSRRYLPYIENVLKENGLPADLTYVPVAESALLPDIRSRKGAVGLWQFMPYTGRKYGLRIDRYVDERRDLFASTGAAVRYLGDLYEMFGSWELAAAAYNLGEERLLAEIQEQGTNDYYRLHLPLETQRYLFRIISIKLILQDPEKYGFALTDDDYYYPAPSDTVEVDCPQEMPIRIVAQSANTYFKKIKDLNPQLLGHHLAKGTHKVLIPKGAAIDFQARYARLADRYLAEVKESAYIVKEGDNLTAIAEKFDVSLHALTTWNRINLKSPIYPGQRLVIYSD
jgi:hypothetical protein